MNNNPEAGEDLRELPPHCLHMVFLQRKDSPELPLERTGKMGQCEEDLRNHEQNIHVVLLWGGITDCLSAPAAALWHCPMS